MVRVAFLHPDLGVGGAERLVVDAAVALKSHGHVIHIFTSHHDKTRCFEETKDGTIPVTTCGTWFPRSLFGVFAAFCAYVRMILATMYLVLFSGFKPDVVFCDQVSVSIPCLRVFNIPVLFYCHYPDLLLARHDTKLRKYYRGPIDFIEQITTGMANMLVVNSQFTASVFRNTFPKVRKDPSVLYPSLNTNFFDSTPQKTVREVIGDDVTIPDNPIIFLSINRYERKKNLGLAIRALNEYRTCVPGCWDRTLLIMAGGYDTRLVENVEYHQELLKQTEELKLNQQVVFLRSPDDNAKLCLLRNATALLYTPSDEHFGIVPLEAMYCGVPVVAVDSGGPKETVVSHETGFLKCNSPSSFAVAMALLAENEQKRETLGKAGRKRVEEYFSFKSFGDNLDSLINQLKNGAVLDTQVQNEEEKKNE